MELFQGQDQGPSHIWGHKVRSPKQLDLDRSKDKVVGGNMARFTQFPLMITRSTIIYEIISPGAAGSSIYV